MVGGLRGQSACLGHSSSVSKLSLEADRREGRREANGRSLRFCTDSKSCDYHFTLHRSRPGFSENLTETGLSADFVG